MITGISDETRNELTIYATLCQSKKILLDRRYDEPLSIFLRFVGMTV